MACRARCLSSSSPRRFRTVSRLRLPRLTVACPQPRLLPQAAAFPLLVPDCCQALQTERRPHQTSSPAEGARLAAAASPEVAIVASLLHAHAGHSQLPLSRVLHWDRLRLCRALLSVRQGARIVAAALPGALSPRRYRRPFRRWHLHPRGAASRGHCRGTGRISCLLLCLLLCLASRRAAGLSVSNCFALSARLPVATTRHLPFLAIPAQTAA